MKQTLTKAAVAILAAFTIVLTGCESDLPTPNEPEIPEIPEEPAPKPAQATIRATYTVEAGETVTLYRYGSMDIENIYLDEKWVPTSHRYTFKEAGEYTFTYQLNSGIVGEQAFILCTPLTAMELGEGVTKIEDNAFSGCTSLKEISMPSTLESIGKGAFQSCASLTSVEIPEGVKRMDGSFNACAALESITLPSTLESIGRGCFLNCISLASITCKAMTAPALDREMFGVKGGGVLTVPTGATGYDEWMKKGIGRLGMFGWTLQYSDAL